jgi:hypothetical protein
VPINQGVPLSLIVAAMGGPSALRVAQDSLARLLPAVTTNGDPILGRQDIAEHVDAILGGKSTESALVVASAAQGGKSFTGELIRSMVIDRGDAAFLLDAEKFAADAPETFARRLVNEIAGSDGGVGQPPSPDSRQRARWISRSLSEWTRSRVSREGGADDQVPSGARMALWVILDRCDAVRFSQETHDLLVALIAEEENQDQMLRFLLLGYQGDLGAVPPGRVWRCRLDLVSVTGVLPYMQFVLASLGVEESPEAIRKGAADWVETVKGVGITEIPKVVLGLKNWAETRKNKAAEAAKDQEQP